MEHESAVQVPQVGLIEQSSELFNTFLGAREGASAEGGFVLRYTSEGLKAKMGRMGDAQRVNEKSPVRAI